MPNFKVQLAKDIDTVFLNTEEYGELHRIFGMELPCVINNNSLEQAAQILALDSYTSYLLLHISRASLEKIGRIPVEGNLFNLDGKNYRVMKVGEELGMMEIALERDESL